MYIVLSSPYQGHRTDLNPGWLAQKPMALAIDRREKVYLYLRITNSVITQA